MGKGDTSMGSAVTGVKVMGLFAAGLVGLAIISVIGIAVLSGFESTQLFGNTTDNITTTGEATLTLFIAGIAVFGTFSSIIALVLIGKIVMKLVK